MIEYVKEHRMGRDGVSTVVRPSQPHTPRSSGQTGPPAADPTQLTAWGVGGGDALACKMWRLLSPVK